MPATPSDLFVHLWKLLEGAAALPPSPAASLKSEGHRLLEEALGRHPFDAAGLLAWACDDPARIVLLAQSIDRAHAPLCRVPTPSPSTMPEWLADARARYIRTSRLNVDMHARQVILRRPLRGRWADPDRNIPDGEGISGFFQHLLVLPDDIPATDARDRDKAVKVGMAFGLHRIEALYHPSPGTPLRIGFAPVMQDPADSRIDVFSHGGHDWYDACPAPLDGRIDEVIRSLCEAGCHIIALPEMALHPSTRSALVRSVRAHGPASDLMLVLAGTCRAPASGEAIHAGVPVPAPSNRAMVLDRLGKIILEQDKLSCWDLTQGQCERFGLAAAASGKRLEYITPGTNVSLAEYDGFGRLGVLVCEDLSRVNPGAWLRQHMLLDLQFTPILDGPVKRDTWTGTNGGLAAQQGGCRVIVANSLALTHQQNEANQARGDLGRIVREAGIGLMIDQDAGATKLDVVTIPLASGAAIVAAKDWAPTTWSDA